MVRGNQDILTWFDNSGNAYWRIYAHKNIQSGNIVMQSRQEEGQSHGDALQDLQHKIKVLNRGTYTLVSFPEPNKLPTKGYWFTDIEIAQSEPISAHVSGPPAISEIDITTRINEALDKYKREQELSDLKKENAELKKEKRQLESSINDPWNKVMGALAPHSEQIIGSIFPAPTALAGIPVDPGPEDNNIVEEEVLESTDITPEQLQVVNDFVNALAASDPDWITLLKRLTKAIVDKPSMIAMVKNFI